MSAEEDASGGRINDESPTNVETSPTSEPTSPAVSKDKGTVLVKDSAVAVKVMGNVHHLGDKWQYHFSYIWNVKENILL